MPKQVNLKTACSILDSAQRIAVVGVSGAGKSTLSQRLAAALDLRYVSLDRDMRWLPGWTVRDRKEQRGLHDSFVATDRWVIDGTNVSFFDTRLPRSELMIWLRMPRLIALSGVARRVISTYGRVRPDMAEGCPEQLPDLEFLRWIWNFEQDVSPRIIDAVDRLAPDLPVLVLRHRSEIEELLSRAGSERT